MITMKTDLSPEDRGMWHIEQSKEYGKNTREHALHILAAVDNLRLALIQCSGKENIDRIFEVLQKVEKTASNIKRVMRV